MYYALLRFGWHWDFSIKRAKPVKIGRKMVARAQIEPPVTVAAQQEIEGARDWIQSLRRAWSKSSSGPNRKRTE